MAARIAHIQCTADEAAVYWLTSSLTTHTIRTLKMAAFDRKSQPHLCLTVVLFGTLATAVTFLSATLPGSVLQVSTVTQNSSPTHPFLISVV